jgi:RNA polymerase primary sigma factor
MTQRFETSETLPQYFKEITQVEDHMTKEEEQALARRIQKGDDAALQKLVSANLKYVVKMANKFIGMGVSVDDLIQEGNIGLIEAAKRYQPTADTKFLTYAKFWIRKSLNLALCQHGRTVRLPVNQEYDIYKQKMKGESPNLANVRIDSKVGEDKDTTIGDLMLHDDFNDPFANQDTDRIMKVFLEVLKPTEKRIVELFYGLNGGDGMSTKEVADEVGRTPAEINRALKVARAKMKRIAR